MGYIESDWMKFGSSEMKEAVKLHEQMHRIDSSGYEAIYVDLSCGRAFLEDGDGRQWRLNSNDEIEEYFTCEFCGMEGFADELKENAEECCINYLKECGAMDEDTYICPECKTEGDVDDLVENGNECCIEYLKSECLIDEDDDDEV